MRFLSWLIYMYTYTFKYMYIFYIIPKYSNLTNYSGSNLNFNPSNLDAHFKPYTSLMQSSTQVKGQSKGKMIVAPN